MTEELKKLRDKAEGGPWKAFKYDQRPHDEDVYVAMIGAEYDICRFKKHSDEANAEYIVALHNANLIDRVDELERVNKVSKVVVDAWEVSEKELLKKVEHLTESRDRWKKACGNNLRDAYDEAYPKGEKKT